MSRPAVVFGGPSPEHDVSILTGLQAARALIDGGTEPVALYWSRAGTWHTVAPDLEAEAFLAGVPAKAGKADLVAGPDGGFTTEGRLGRRNRIECDAVLNCCHGGPGEDGTLQGALDLAGIPHAGPSAPGAALGMDKLAFAGVVSTVGLPALERVPFGPDSPDPATPGPWILKPRFGGSSIGIEVTDDPDAARALVRTQPHLRAGAVLEPYVDTAVDLNVSVRTWPAVAVSAVERPLRSDAGGTAVYTYAEKYLGGEGLASAPRELPATLPDGLAERLQTMARRLVEPCGVRGVARFDFLWSGDDVWVNEVNTIPGALAWYFWSAEGVPFGRLLGDLLDEARNRPGRTWSTEGADGSALRAAGSIAGKLA